MVMFSEPVAYLITFTCYGTWLHGDQRGSVDSQHAGFGMVFVEPSVEKLTKKQALLRYDTVTLTPQQRILVHQAIKEVCQFRNWQLHIANIRTNHVHIVVSGNTKPENMMTDFKRYASRKLMETNEFPKETKTWTRYGSTRYLWTDDALQAACRYVEEQ
jgi:Transposase and inactivated derivatives